MTQYRRMVDRRLVDRALHALVRTRWARALFTGPFSTLDRHLMHWTGGRVQLAVGSPVLLLHHRGARSGAARTTPLLYTARGEDLIVVASKGGAEQHPAWYHNLRADPDVEVEIRGHWSPRRAREVIGEERAEIWEYVNDHFSGYELYQSGVTRTIPVVVLEPRPGS